MYGEEPVEVSRSRIQGWKYGVVALSSTSQPFNLSTSLHSSDLKSLVHYNYWARDRMIDAVAKLTPEQYLKPLGNSFSSVRDTVVHLYGAEWLWFMRFRGEAPSALPKADGFPDLASVRAAWSDTEAGWRSLVANLDDNDVDTVIRYKMLSGLDMASPISAMIQHVVNHATYHRGQVTTMLRQLGAEPPKSMDLIYYYREVSAA
jgi:uncharacterized damage-inducible protein DinB